MSRHDSEIGYRYTLALCEAIETYLKSAQQEDPQRFVYHDSPLPYALSRTLYTSFVNSTRLTDEYTKTGTVLLAQKMQTVRRPVRAIIGTLLRTSGCTMLIRLIRMAATPTKVNSVRPEILLCVESERFARFLEPVALKIKVPYSYLTYDTNAATYLKSVGLPCILISRFGARLARLGQKESLLSRFGIVEKYDLLENTFLRIRPMSVVVVEGNAAFDEIVNQLAKKYGSSSVCIQQGWSPIVHIGFRDMSFSKMLVWGDGFAKLLTPYNPAQKFISTGSPVMTVGQRANTSGPFTIAFLPQGASPLMNEEALEEFLSFARTIAERFPAVSVIVREHPRYPLAKDEKDALTVLPNVMFRSPPAYSLDDVMKESTISASVYSTTILESIAGNVVPLVFNVTSMPHFSPDVAACGAGIEVKNSEQALSALTPLIEHPENLERFRTSMETFQKEYFTRGKEEAIRAIVKEIESK